MQPERTEFEWRYEPPGFFEAPYRCATVDFDLALDAGKALATLHVPTDPVSQELEERVKEYLEAILFVRQLQVHREYTLEGPNTYQHSAAGKSISVRPAADRLSVMGENVDFVMRDPSGKIVRDTKGERIAEDTAFLDLVASKAANSPLLRTMLEIYSRAVSDPNKELVHLYDVREALSRHYQGKEPTKKALGIREGDWSQFGKLANDEPIRQGRHAGAHHQSLRDVTEAELEKARSLVKQWITAFARTV